MLLSSTHHDDAKQFERMQLQKRVQPRLAGRKYERREKRARAILERQMAFMSQSARLHFTRLAHHSSSLSCTERFYDSF